MKGAPISREGRRRRGTAGLGRLGPCFTFLIGLLLVVPAHGARDEAACASPVTVARGDTLSLIARRCGTTLGAMIAANPQIRNPDLVPVGATLALPESATDDSQPSPVIGTLTVEPSEAAPGDRITLKAAGMPPRARIWIKGGSSSSPQYHLVLRGARTDAEGELNVTLRLPRWAAGPGRFNISVEVPRTGALLDSPPITVTSRRATRKAE